METAGSHSRPGGQKKPARAQPVIAGDILPSAKINLHGGLVNLREYFQDRTGVLFGVQGAFMPCCTKKHLPSIRDTADEIRRHVDFVGCVVVNDPFVVKAWAKKLGISDQFTLIADSNADFTRALGVQQTNLENGVGLRSRRFCMIIGPKARIKWIGFDDSAFPQEVLRQLPLHVRAPWKSLLVNISYRGDEEAQLEGTDMAAERMKKFITSEQQGFSEEADWQLILSDSADDSFRPTKENIMNGMRWLVEGTQAGDSLFFYFGGRGARVDQEGAVILPLDWRENGSISARFMVDTLAKPLPGGCRLTVVFDGEGGGVFQLPYVATAEDANEATHLLENRMWDETLIPNVEDSEECDRLMSALRDGVETEGLRKLREECLAGLEGELLLVTAYATSTTPPVPYDQISSTFVVSEASARCSRFFIEAMGSTDGSYRHVLQSMHSKAAEADVAILSTRQVPLDQAFSVVDPLGSPA